MTEVPVLLKKGLVTQFKKIISTYVSLFKMYLVGLNIFGFKNSFLYFTINFTLPLKIPIACSIYKPLLCY